MVPRVSGLERFHRRTFCLMVDDDFIHRSRSARFKSRRPRTERFKPNTSNLEDDASYSNGPEGVRIREVPQWMYDFMQVHSRCRSANPEDDASYRNGPKGGWIRGILL